MSLVRAQCTSCGAALEVDEGGDTAVCPFCKMPYIIEKAVNLYTINNTIHIEKAVFESEDSEEKLLKRGIAQLEMKEYEDARVTFTRMTKLYPQDHRGWLGLILADSESNTGCAESEQAARYRENALLQCPKEERAKLKNMYISSPQRIESLTEQIRKDEELIISRNADIKEYEKRLACYDKSGKRTGIIKKTSLAALIFSPVFTMVFLILFIKMRINVLFYAGLLFFCTGIISFLIFRYVSARDDNESREIETAAMLDEAKSLIADHQVRIEALKKYLEEVNRGEPLEYYIDLLKV